MTEPSILSLGSLVSASLSALAGQIWRAYKEIMPLNSSGHEWSESIHKFENVILPIFETIPTMELAQSLMDNLFLLNATFGFICSILASKYVQRVSDIVFPSFTEKCGLVPLDFLASRLGSALPHLKRIEIGGTVVNDQVLRAIAESSAASTLEGLELSDSCITDASKGLWCHFKSLLDLSMLPSPRITLATIQEIAKLPKIEKLYLSTGYDYIDDIIKIILAPEALPSLRKFIVCGPGSEGGLQETFFKLLEERETSHLLEEMTFGSSNGNSIDVMDDEKLCRLRTLCPNLVSHLDGASFSLSDTRLPNLQSLREMYIMSDIADNLMEIAAAAPHVTELLYYNEAPSNGINFSMFSSLENLVVMTSCAIQIASLPSQLTLLSITAAGDDSGSGISQLCQLITTQCLHLTKISITLSQEAVSGKHISTLLQCPQLEALRIGTNDDTNHEEDGTIIVLRHLRLQELELKTRATTSRFRFDCLPNLRKLTLDTLDLCSLHNSPREVFPMLHSLQLKSGLGKYSLDVVEKICTAVTSLRGLNFGDFQTPTGIDFNTYAPYFYHARDLSVLNFEGALSWEQLCALCDSFPRLSVIRIKLDNNAPCTRPLKHYQLQALELSAGPTTSSTTTQIESLGELNFLGENLPLLQELRFSFTNSCSIVISNLPCLQSLSLSSDYDEVCKEARKQVSQLHVSACPVLVSMHLKSFVVSSLKLECSPSKLEIIGVRFWERHLIDLQIVDSLRKIKLDSSEEDQIEIYNGLKGKLRESNPALLTKDT